jgi:hypothetical protein
MSKHDILVNKTKDSVNMKNMSHPAHRPASIAIGSYAKNLSVGRSLLGNMEPEERARIPSIIKVSTTLK